MSVLRFYPNRTLKIAVIFVLTLGLAAPTAAQTALPIAVGDTVTGQITADSSWVLYDLPSSDQPLVARMTSDEFSPSLGYVLYSPGRQSVTSVSGLGDTMFIPPIAEGQTMQIQAGPRSLPSEGGFSLTLEAVELQPIAYGEAVGGTFDDEGASRYYVFEGSVGDVLTIEASGELDTELHVYTDTPSSFAADEDSGPGHNPEIYQRALSIAGTTYLEVRPTYRGDTGNFTLTITPESPLSLQEGEPLIVRVGPARPVAVATFRGTPGRIFQVTVTATGGEPEGATTWLYENDIRVAEAEYADTSPLVIEQEAHSDGLIYVLITADQFVFSYVPARFEVALTWLS